MFLTHSVEYTMYCILVQYFVFPYTLNLVTSLITPKSLVVPNRRNFIKFLNIEIQLGVFWKCTIFNDLPYKSCRTSTSRRDSRNLHKKRHRNAWWSISSLFYVASAFTTLDQFARDIHVFIFISKLTPWSYISFFLKIVYDLFIKYKYGNYPQTTIPVLYYIES